jgi:predicted secreted protein
MPTLVSVFRLALLAVLGAAISAPMHAQPAMPAMPMHNPSNIVHLSASATTEVAMDWLVIVFSTSREGSDAAAVQTQLRQALETALTEARKGAKPGQLEVRTGNFALNPRYGAPQPRSNAPTITGWVGSAELVVEGRDSAAIAALTGRITTLSIARVSQSLSREAREKVEADVAAQAIARFRTRAEAVSRQFGFAGYTLREVQVNSAGEAPVDPQPMMMARASRAMADESLPVAAGKAAVTANVSGSVQMTK